MTVRLITVRLILTILLGASAAALAATPFSNPPEIVSQGGVLGGTLTAAPATVQVGAKRVNTTVYNGLLMPPLLRSRIAADDSLRACNALWDAVLLDELRQPLLRREIPEFPDQ